MSTSYKSAVQGDGFKRASELNAQAVSGFPNSSKIYQRGSRADLRVPFREIRQADTHTRSGPAGNAPVYVYDTSGPYTDPTAHIDVRQGLPALRQTWIEERGDTEQLAGRTSNYGRQRSDDPALASLRFEHIRAPRRARAGANVTQLHYARRGIVTPEMEFIA
ncbi:MAG: phosphomethylpyrimidine synthase ThiC, partial [Gammaproteobacteria bacterium]|nr:phosphomethylpyrimidine synthase ThiC [Gammaproteobacteria bacterium]